MTSTRQGPDWGYALPRRLEGQVAAVTGAANGIGRAAAIRMGREGASVFTSDINESGLESLEAEFGEFEASIATGVFDGAKVADAERFIATVVDRFGRIDVLVNNAGGVRAEVFPEIQEATWDWTFDLNAKGPFFYMQAAVKRMMEQGSGTVINLASIAGIQPGITLSPSYAAAKAVIINMTKMAAAKLAETGITVNAVGPGIVDSPFNWNLDEAWGQRVMGLEPGEFMKQRAASVPQKRLQQPEEIAATIAFLASPEAAAMTGETVTVSGGIAMR